MNKASYKLLRYIPDLARNEPINIGVFASCADQAVIKFDEKALERASSANRELADNVMTMITEEIEAKFNEARLRDEQDCEEFLRSVMKTPFIMTENFFVGIPDTPESGLYAVLANEVDSLLDRLVKPHRQRRPGSPKGPKSMLFEGYRRFLEPDQLTASYEVTRTGTGLVRTVDMFINHSVDTAVDLVDLRRDSTRDAAISATDAIKAKSQDILSGNEVRVVVVHLPADVRQELNDYVPVMKMMLKKEPDIAFTSSATENLELVRKLTGR